MENENAWVAIVESSKAQQPSLEIWIIETGNTWVAIVQSSKAQKPSSEIIFTSIRTDRRDEVRIFCQTLPQLSSWRLRVKYLSTQIPN